MSALTKVDVPLSERYETKCVECGWDRQFFGTKTEARASALNKGWEFRIICAVAVAFGHGRYHPVTDIKESVYCPHCRLLVKADAPVAQFRAPGS